MKMMILSTAAVLSLLANSILAHPIQPDLLSRQSCTINLDLIEWWSEALLIRRRFRPTQTGATYNMENVLKDWWEPSRGSCSSIATTNVQIFEDKRYGWVVDASEVAGPVGENVQACVVKHLMDRWGADSSCTIAADSCGRSASKLDCEPEFQPSVVATE